MRLIKSWLIPAALFAACTVPALGQEPYWQCAAFARQFSGIDIRGDAWTWWGLAEGRYAKGQQPRRGAVMSFTPYGAMRLGHVATVTQVIGPRDIAVTHANWSPINGTRGQIERDVVVRDVSNNNDWSQVRVWYAPTGALGTTTWPVDGFIYGKKLPVSLPTRPRSPLAGLAADSRTGRFDSHVDAGMPQRRLRLPRDVMRLAALENRRSH